MRGLASGGHAKPVDFGNGRLCASFGPSGAWLSLGIVHPDGGFMEMTGLPRFDERWRGSSTAVRRYRHMMTLAQHAFLRVEPAARVHAWKVYAPVDGQSMSATYLLCEEPEECAGRAPVRVLFRGRLAPHPYPEITETDPLPYPVTPSRLETEGNVLVVRSADPPAQVHLTARARRTPWRDGQGRDRPLAWRLDRVGGTRASMTPPHEGPGMVLRITCQLSVPSLPPLTLSRRSADLAARGRKADPDQSRLTALAVPPDLVAPVERMTHRALTYVRRCTALSVTAGERVILADHRILPLSWTRDAYWQARLLLSRGRSGDSADSSIVSDHLRWLFLRCERPTGAWARSHLANGRRKDRPFQADQQLYPLLELADYIIATGVLPEVPAGISWAALARGAWKAVEAAIDPATGLIASDENPADDRAVLPFLCSSQILLWHTSARLAAIAPAIGLSAVPFRARARVVRRAVARHLVTEGPFGPMWAYAVDARGALARQADANDLPTFLAPLWGYCEADDPVWRSTVRFAFEGDHAGTVRVATGGLGSPHTPGAWTLGDVARWLTASLLGERDSARAALERLVGVAFSDGMLPEAYDPRSGQPTARHWFAWPGAALGVLAGLSGDA